MIILTFVVQLNPRKIITSSEWNLILFTEQMQNDTIYGKDSKIKLPLYPPSALFFIRV